MRRRRMMNVRKSSLKLHKIKKPLKVPSLARSVPKPLLIFAADLLPSWSWKWKVKVKSEWSVFGPLIFLKLIYESRQNFSTWFWGSNGPLKKKVPRYLFEILSFCNYRPYNTKKLYFWGLKMSLRGTFLKKKGTPRGPFLVQGLIYEKVHFFLLKIFIFFAKKCQKGTFSKKKGTF